MFVWRLFSEINEVIEPSIDLKHGINYTTINSLFSKFRLLQSSPNFFIILNLVFFDDLIKEK
jgi:hypothetical protein